MSESLAARQKIGVLPHGAGLYPQLSARENIAYYARLCGLSGETLEARVDNIIELLEIRDFADRRTKGFSQGQRTKVALARALVHDPKNVILDEPTNGLDVMATRGLRELILKLKEDGRCVLFSSHIMQEVAALCDDIVIIASGQVAMEGTIDRIREKTGSEKPRRRVRACDRAGRTGGRSVSTFFTVYRKEILDYFRDRRTLLTSLLTWPPVWADPVRFRHQPDDRAFARQRQRSARTAGNWQRTCAQCD